MNQQWIGDQNIKAIPAKLKARVRWVGAVGAMRIYCQGVRSLGSGHVLEGALCDTSERSSSGTVMTSRITYHEEMFVVGHQVMLTPGRWPS